MLCWVCWTEVALIGQNSAVWIVVLCASRPVCSTLHLHALNTTVSVFCHLVYYWILYTIELPEWLLGSLYACNRLPSNCHLCHATGSGMVWTTLGRFPDSHHQLVVSLKHYLITRHLVSCGYWLGSHLASGPISFRQHHTHLFGGCKDVCLICCTSKDDPNVNPWPHEQPHRHELWSLFCDGLVNPYMVLLDGGMQDEVPRAFLCLYPDCGKTYPKKFHLRVHLWRHIGERPFTCQWPGCSRWYSRSDQLARHRCSHMGYKIHNCKICNKTFSNLITSRNTKIHSKPKTPRVEVKKHSPSPKEASAVSAVPRGPPFP